MLLHLAFPTATFDVSSTICAESKVYSYFRRSLATMCENLRELSYPIKYFCTRYNRWQWVLFLCDLPIVCGRKLNKLFIHQLAKNKVRETQVATNREWKQSVRRRRHVPKILYSLRADVRVWFFLYLCSLVSDSHGERPEVSTIPSEI